ncbi:MAG: hypothetical protein PHW21_01720 [Candidatus Izemoplasmatales bacterium]|nr:hypothetical protein [Candidatus Izemoplasmatales bacterium]
MELLFTFIVLLIYSFFKNFIKKHPGIFNHTTYYEIDKDYIYDKSEFTDRQKYVFDYIARYGKATEKDIIKECQTSKIVINNLKKKGVIKKMKFRNIKTKDILIMSGILIALLGLMLLMNYFMMIKANFRYSSMFIFIGIYLLIGFNIVFFYIKFDEDLYKKIMMYSVSGLISFLFLFYIFGGRPIFHAEEYANLIEVTEADFVEDINTVDIDSLPIVDKSYGSKLGSLKLGEYPGIGSEFKVGDYSDIIYQGKQYLVAPLEYRGFFKWTSNNDIGTPGYILIDKITSETQLINLRESTGKGMKFVPSAFFGQDLLRHAYYNGLSKYKLENYFFEIDEEGNPYYVLQYSLPTIFINGGAKINKTVVIDAIDGDINIYEPNDVPDWVESVYPNHLIFQHLNYWGSLQDGWFNSVFAQKGVIQTSSGTRVIMNEGELFYFTGLTSAGNDESTIGFIYANMKTNETKLYRFPGATEEAAMNKALTLIPQNNISSSFPIPMNILDTPSYFVLIKGEDGRILRYVFIKIQDLDFNVISEKSKMDAYNLYLTKLSDDDEGITENVSGTIDKITSYVIQGNTIYWIEVNGKLYMINVVNFTSSEMQHFISKDVGDSIDFETIGSNIIKFNE